MAVPSEVRRVETAIANKNHKELEWSLWYCRLRQTVPSARPADIKYWRAVEAKVEETLAPPAAEKAFPARRKKAAGRGIGLSLLPGETPPEEPA